MDKNRNYKVARFCNTMKVYQKFCKLTGVPLDHRTDAMYTDDAENSDHHMFKAIDKNKRSMRFKQYSVRKDISDGEYSAHEDRFLETPRSTLRDYYNGRA